MIFDETRYSRPKEMIGGLYRQNFHLMVSIWAGLGPKSEIYKEMDKDGYFFLPLAGPDSSTLMSTLPPPRIFTGSMRARDFFSNGVDGWWMDSTEPDIVNALTQEGEEYEMKRERTIISAPLPAISILIRFSTRRLFITISAKRQTRSEFIFLPARPLPASSGRGHHMVGRHWRQLGGLQEADRRRSQPQHVRHSLLDLRHRRIFARNARAASSWTAARIPRIRSFIRACSSLARFPLSSGRTARKLRARSGSLANILLRRRIRQSALPPSSLHLFAGLAGYA